MPQVTPQGICLCLLEAPPNGDSHAGPGLPFLLPSCLVGQRAAGMVASFQISSFMDKLDVCTRAEETGWALPPGLKHPQ